MSGRHAFFKNDAPFVDVDNSQTFETKARLTLADLFAKVGKPAYRAWWERVFEVGGKTADDFTWKEIYNAALLEMDRPREDELKDIVVNRDISGWQMMPSGYYRWICPTCGDENAGNPPVDPERCGQCGGDFSVNYSEVRWSIRTEN